MSRTAPMIAALLLAGSAGPCGCRRVPAEGRAQIPSKSRAPIAADAGALDAHPLAAQVDRRGGVLCVAPLDHSETPGKGAMTVERFNAFEGGPTPVPRNARAVVNVNGVEREITLTKGARFDGLPLDAPVKVTIARPGDRPYFGKRLSFAKEGADALCLYENAFYATVQISPVPRRAFCRECMKGSAP